MLLKSQLILHMARVLLECINRVSPLASEDCTVTKRSLYGKRRIGQDEIGREAVPKFTWSWLFGWIACAVFAGTLAPKPTWAQSAPAAPTDTLEEVIVTATKRDTVLKDTPIAIQVFNATAIENENIQTPADFVLLTPNTFVNGDVQKGQTNISMRGIQGNFNLTQPVAVVLDGVVQANTGALDEELFDIKQIEVVKGPQGALYGRNAEAGAIIITTETPNNTFMSKILAGYGNAGQYKAQAVISGPIVSDKLFGRLGVSDTGQSGFWPDWAVGHPLDQQANRLANGRLVFVPTDDLTIDLRGDRSEFKGIVGEFTAQIAQSFDPPVGVPFNVNTNFPEFQANNAPPQTEERSDVSIKVDDNLHFAVLTLIASYDNYVYKIPEDGSFNPLIFSPSYPTANPPLLPAYSYSTADGNQYRLETRIDRTVELRLTSPSDQRFRWSVGGYAAGSSNYSYADSRTDKGEGIIQQTLGQDPGLLNPAGPNPILSITTDDWNSAKDFAAFGQIQYDILANLQAEIALRWDEENKLDVNQTPNEIDPSTGKNFVTNPAVAPSGITQRGTYVALQPKFSLRYKVTDDVSVYASAGRGFRSGGFNPAGTEVEVQQQLPTSHFPDAYPSEKSDAYEIGIKSFWLDRRLMFNGALFYTNITDAQSFTAFPNPPIELVISEPKVRSQGVEAEFSYLLAPDLRVSENFGYTDATIRASSLENVAGNRVPGTPEVSNVASLDYDPTLPGSNLRLAAHLDVDTTGNVWFDDFNTPGTERSPITLVNVRVGLTGDRNGDKWQVAAWSKNLTNKYYNAYDAAVPGVANYTFRANPRAYGLDLSYRF
jgi:iron complex outermembrane receptor protein